MQYKSAFTVLTVYNKIYNYHILYTMNNLDKRHSLCWLPAFVIQEEFIVRRLKWFSTIPLKKVKLGDNIEQVLALWSYGHATCALVPF